MNISDAVVRDIPEYTTSEEKDRDIHEVQDILGIDDIRGLDFSFRRHRRIKANSIDEYLNDIVYSPAEDGEEENLSPRTCHVGIFKKGYKMKLIDNQQESESKPNLDEKLTASTPPKLQADLCSVSTKSEIKSLSSTGKPFFSPQLFNSSDHIVERIIDTSVVVFEAGIIQEGHMYLDDSICESKIFMTPQGIIRICDSPHTVPLEGQLNLETKSELDHSEIQNFNEDLGQQIERSTKYKRFLGGLTDIFISTNTLTSQVQEQAVGGATAFFSLESEKNQLILLEFNTEEHMPSHQILVAVYVCHLPSAAHNDKCTGILTRLHSYSRQEGYCTMLKFLCRLLDVPTTSASLIDPPKGGSTIGVPHGHIKSMDFQDLELSQLRLQRRNLSSCDQTTTPTSGFDLSPAIIKTADCGVHLRTATGTRMSPMDGSFSL